MLVAGQKEIFTKNFDAYPTEYPQFTVNKDGVKEIETFDSMGNLGEGGEKMEGDAINYNKVEQAYQTSIKSKTWANGYAHTIEAIKFDLYGVINSVKAKELARTMRELEEKRAIKRIDEAATANLADGVPLASDSHPLKNAPGQFNDTQAAASSLSDPDNHKTMVNMFYDFKNHAGGPMKTKPTDGLTHYTNMLTVEEIYKSVNKANEFSNTKNVLPKINWKYSTYISSRTAWMMWDSDFDHVLFVWWMKTDFDTDQDKISTKNYYLNAVAMYETGALPNIGFVYNAGV
jgi:hypothetical protein